MTDNEIKKALEECLQKCQTIKYGARKSVFVQSDLLQNALDLINRQKAEIDRLTALLEIERFYGTLTNESSKTAKSEAIKEFAEQVIKQSCLFYDGKQYVSADNIRKLAKKKW